MIKKLKNKKKSKFFKFLPKKYGKTFKFYSFKGWNKSLIVKFVFDQPSEINNSFIKKNFPQILDKEKIFILTSGKIKFKSPYKSFDLKKLDAISIFSDNLEYNFNCKKKSELFVISSEKLKTKKQRPVYFNFKKDIKAIDIWGGKCLSRPYSGTDLNIVLFDLKKGFKFFDKGHSNEQITWLISGSMNFYSGKLKNKLTKNQGIDIGYFNSHGGLSNGAIGFDAFFPKRSERKYKNNINLTRF